MTFLEMFVMVGICLPPVFLMWWVLYKLTEPIKIVVDKIDSVWYAISKRIKGGYQMKVYRIEAYGRFCAGMAVVAAYSESGALFMASTIRDSIWDVNYSQGQITLLPEVTAMSAGVITHFVYGE